MNNSENISKANKSFKWKAFAEVLAKIIAPMLNMVLVRFIAPHIFGIVATIYVVTGLATALSESELARYVQQHQFNSDEERKKLNKTSLTSSIVSIYDKRVLFFKKSNINIVICEIIVENY